LDMGFEPDVRAVIDQKTMPSKDERLTLMFSATFPIEIQTLARDFLKPNHAFIAVGIVGAANSDIVQVIEEVDQYTKKKPFD